MTILASGELASLIEAAGESVTYTPSGGDAVTLNAVVQETGPKAPDYAPADWGYDYARWADVMLDPEDLAAEPAAGDTVTDGDGTAWTVRFVKRCRQSGARNLACSTDERAV